MSEIGIPQNVTTRPINFGQREYQNHLLDKLAEYKYRPRAPIHDMMTAPNNLYQTMNDSNSDLLEKIMENVYHFGRSNWTWTATTKNDTMQPYDESASVAIAQLPLSRTGRGLLDGNADSCACGGFAAALRGMAGQIFGILTKKPNVNGSTSIEGDFITGSGAAVIDSQWKGNVWIDGHANMDMNRQNNQALAAFEFQGHYFCNYEDTIYDVTCNKTFANTSAMVWCNLTKDDTLVGNYPGSTSVHTVAVNTRDVYAARQYLVRINREPGIGNGFSNWLMTDRTSIPANEMAKTVAWSSR